MFKETLEKHFGNFYPSIISIFKEIKEVNFFLYDLNSKRVSFSCPLRLDANTKLNLDYILNNIDDLSSKSDSFFDMEMWWPNNKEISKGILNIGISADYEEIPYLYNKIREFYN